MKGFTIIEILITLAIIVVLAGIMSQIFKPTVYFQKARDVKRITDLKAIEIAIRNYLLATSSPSLGPLNTGYDESSTTIFISIPFDKEDAPASIVWVMKNYALNQVSSTNVFKNNGEGWLPINFKTLTYPFLSSLPIDPVNIYNYGRYFYSYLFKRSSSTFELNAKLESPFYNQGGDDDKTSTDNGDNSIIYELGTEKTLIPPNLYAE